MTVTIEELSGIEPDLRWMPRQGDVTADFLKRKVLAGEASEEALHTVAFEAHRILGRCVPPKDPDAEATGLVVGYVQSGKTLSFTTLTALARDNGFGVVILIAGTIDNLKSQSEDRLKQDLAISDEPGQPWVLVDNPAPHNSGFEALKLQLGRWRSPSVSQRKKKTILITVLKQHQRLANLVECLRHRSINLHGVPCLVIDDEADQASLNNCAAKNKKTNQNNLSANYREVTNLKAVLPHHTYIQYTATPQAPLLIALADILSPDFAETLTPGQGYVGGDTLFANGSRYAKAIPSAEAVATAASYPTAPPSLMDALRVFLLGACAHALAEQNSNRTMMVHPSQQTAPHTQYLDWIRTPLREWKSWLSDPVLRATLQEQFVVTHADLMITVGEKLPGLDVLFVKMDEVLDTVMVREVNSTGKGAAPIRWGDNEYWILVGGQKLDRGYTVKGLTVTYMPRPLGVGNADNIQQRARFYGYKAGYLGYCRVYVRTEVKTAFESYIEHEDFIRSELEGMRGQPLKEWKRKFILADRLQPTRRSIMGIGLDEVAAADWLHPKAAHVNRTAVAHNRRVFDDFVGQLRNRFEESLAHEVAPDRYLDKRKNSPRNKLFEAVPLIDAYEQLLSAVQLGTPEDATERTAMLVVLGRLLAESPTEICDVFLVGDLQPQNRSLRKQSINQVFMGKSPNTPDRALLKYCGDRELHSEERVTLHLRCFEFLKSAIPVGPEDASSDVPWFAIHIPDNLKKRILLQSET
ncbi:Z1 domain-containing protein [Propionivibrio sp.]|uniref:Z1 domain-containing protein n=1 Tax=Propionivibrio sp. TaxID=2212460 RepID=UPI003BEF68B2